MTANNMSAISWVGTALAIAIWDWVAIALSQRRLGYLTKPAVTLALMVAVLKGNTDPKSPLTWIALGLLFALIGDIALMLPRERLKLGLFAFMATDIAYLAAFNFTAPPVMWETTAVAMVVAIIVGIYYRRIVRALHEKGNDHLRLPLGAYAIAVSLMAVGALLLPLHRELEHGAALAVAAGAVLFLLSDGLLAWHKFVRPLPQGTLLVRITYHIAQALIVTGSLILWGKVMP